MFYIQAYVIDAVQKAQGITGYLKTSIIYTLLVELNINGWNYIGYMWSGCDNLDVRFSAFIWQDAVWHVLRMCSLEFNLSSRVTPNILMTCHEKNVTTDIRIEVIDIASW